MADLRERQLALSRESILEACAELVTEHRHLDFAMKDVAERAGVSLRTVYNHFPAREDLLDGLGQVFDERMRSQGAGSAEDLTTLDDLLEIIPVNLATFDQLGGISEAFAQLPLADVGADADRQERTRRIAEFIADQMPDAPDSMAIALVLRHLLSHRSWFWLTREYGLSTPQVAEVVTWATHTLIAAARSGDLPSPTEEP